MFSVHFFRPFVVVLIAIRPSASSDASSQLAGVGQDPASGVAMAGSSCPRVCFCNSPSRIVYCSRRGLASIPDGVAGDSLQLNLNGNAFQSTTIVRSNMSRYTMLEHLYISECQLEHIQVGAFADLVALRWLDLSNNRLRSLQADTFSGLVLQHLFLNGNRNIQLVPDSFAGLVTTGLYLHDCSLTSLAADVLDPLNATLRYLWLNGNELDHLDRRLAVSFSRLNHVRLGSNPLRCGCESVWLKRFYDRHSDAFRGAMAPSCLHPVRLRGRLFSELTVGDLRCQAPTFTALEAHFYDVSTAAVVTTPSMGLSDAETVGDRHSVGTGTVGDGHSVGTGVRMRCAAVGDPLPTLYWIRPNGKTTRYDRPANRARNEASGFSDDDGETNENEGVLELPAATSLVDELATSSGSQSDGIAGTYTCIANNEAGNVTLTMVVPVQRTNHAMSAAVHKHLMSSTTAHRVRLMTSSPISYANPLPQSPHHDPMIQSSLLGDSLRNLRRLQLNDITGSRSHEADPSYRLIDLPDVALATDRTAPKHDETGENAMPTRYDLQSAPGRFSASDLACAVVATHVATLLLCAVAAAACRVLRGGTSDKGCANCLSIYCFSSSSPRSQNRKSPSGSARAISGIGSVAACRALKAAYDRRAFQQPPQWSSSQQRSGSVVDCSGGEYDNCETTVRPTTSIRAADSFSVLSGGGQTPSTGRRFVAISSAAEDDTSESIYLNGVQRYGVPSYSTNTANRKYDLRGGVGGLTLTTYVADDGR